MITSLISSPDGGSVVRTDLPDMGLDLAGDKGRPHWRAAVFISRPALPARNVPRRSDCRHRAPAPPPYARRQNLRALDGVARILGRLCPRILGRDEDLERPHGDSVLDDAPHDFAAERVLDAKRDVERS